MTSQPKDPIREAAEKVAWRFCGCPSGESGTKWAHQPNCPAVGPVESAIRAQVAPLEQALEDQALSAAQAFREVECENLALKAERDTLQACLGRSTEEHEKLQHRTRVVVEERDTLKERYKYLLTFARRLERLSYYDDAPGYHRIGDVANGAMTRASIEDLRAKFLEWFPLPVRASQPEERPTSQPEGRQHVGCEREDGTLNIYEAATTCEVCVSPNQQEKREEGK